MPRVKNPAEMPANIEKQMEINITRISVTVAGLSEKNFSNEFIYLSIDCFSKTAALQEDIASFGIIIFLNEVSEVTRVLLSKDS